MFLKGRRWVVLAVSSWNLCMWNIWMIESSSNLANLKIGISRKPYVLIIISLLNSQLEKNTSTSKSLFFLSTSGSLSLWMSISLFCLPEPWDTPPTPSLIICSLLHWKAAMSLVKPNLWELHCFPGISLQETIECSKRLWHSLQRQTPLHCLVSSETHLLFTIKKPVEAEQIKQ